MIVYLFIVRMYKYDEHNIFFATETQNT